MPDFFPIKTADGSVSLYNIKVKDVYHSNIGSYTEAVEKYVKPSGVLDFARKNNSVRILDVCFGLGYNSLAAITEILKINPTCQICVTGLEIDMDVLAFIPVIDYFQADESVIRFYKEAMIQGLNIDKSDVTFAVDNLPTYADIDFNNPSFLQRFKNVLGVSKSTNNNSVLLHNIYYQSISHRNISYSSSFVHSENNLYLEVHVNDARKTIKELNGVFDFIFHDPFTPTKLPTLWSYEIFKELHRLLSENGNLTTYSSNSAVRGAMIEAGFSIGRTEPVGKKMSGTIACKSKFSLTSPLSDYELGLIKTKAGIPYYDPTLDASSDAITLQRCKLQNDSERMSSGRYLKHYNQ